MEGTTPHLVAPPRFLFTAQQVSRSTCYKCCQVVVPGGGLTSDGLPPQWVPSQCFCFQCAARGFWLPCNCLPSRCEGDFRRPWQSLAIITKKSHTIR